MLRRCLGQQGEVRLSLYLGLMELVETTPSLNPIIFEILQAHVSVLGIHGVMMGNQSSVRSNHPLYL